jgi:hypothetical protein
VDKIKLGSQYFEHPKGRLSTELEREGFLSNVERLAPNVLEGLAGEPYRRYLETGIGDLDLTKQTRFRRKNYSYRDIQPFWSRLENQWYTCDYFTTVGAASDQRFIHNSCAAKCRRALYKAVASGKASEYDFLFETSYEHYPPCPKMLAMWRSLVAWAKYKEHNLVEKEGYKKWLLETAFHTLDWWATHPQDPKTSFSLGFSYRERSPYIESLEPPPCLEVWRAEWEDEKDYIRRMRVKAARLINSYPEAFENTKLSSAYRKAFGDEVDKYCRDVKKHFKSKGWRQVRDKPERLKHIEWAVEFQVVGKKFTEISKTNKVDTSTVQREVENILNSIGLEKRRGLRGRPRGSKDSPESWRQSIKRVDLTN